MARTLLITRLLPRDVLARADRDYHVRLNDAVGVLPTDQLVRLAQGADAILCTPMDRLNAAVIAALPDSVRVIGTFSVGYEHIDLAAAKARGIAVVNTPDVTSAPTAEIAMLLILAAARRAGEGERLVRSGGWTGLTALQLLGTGVTGRRLGIFGMGHIGRALARMARGFDMEIHYHNRSRLPPELEQGATYHASEDTMLPLCEVLSLNAPAGPETTDWLNAERIAWLPEGAIVVNTARGTLIDDEALIAALRTGHVRAAGLDVYNHEPRLHPGYLELENVVLLPHIGSATWQARNAMGFVALDGIDAVLAGTVPSNRLV